MEPPAVSSPSEGALSPHTDAPATGDFLQSPLTISQNSQNSDPKPASPWTKIPDSQPTAALVHISAGVARTSIPDDVIYGSQPLWSDCIVGYFIDEPPYVGKIHAAINRLWRTKKQAETKGTMIAVDFLNPTTALFRIPNKKSRDFILGKHVWHIGTTPMVVQQWSPSTAKSAPDMTRIPVWVDFKGVPDALYAEKGLKFLGDIVGKYQCMHSKTEKCLDLEVARILALVNFEQELVNTIALTGTDGEEIIVNVSYPWVPLKCGACNKWGHRFANCPTNKNDEQHVSDKGEAVANTMGNVMGPGQSTSPAPQVQPNTESPRTTIPTDTNHGKTEDTTKTEAGWHKVSGRKSPSKINTSPCSHDVHTPTANPFNVLQIEEHEEGEIEEGIENGNTAANEEQIQNVSVPGSDTAAEANEETDADVSEIQETEIAMGDTQRAGGSTRGRRGRPRKNTFTTTRTQIPATNTTKNKASFRKH